MKSPNDSTKEPIVSDLDYLRDIRDILTKSAERELAFQTKSKFTAVEIIKLSLTTTMNEPLDGVTNSGMFTSPMSSVAISLLNIGTAGATAYVMVNGPANTTRSFELNGTCPTFNLNDFPIRSVYAYMSAGTGRLQIVGMR
jgi:hypothetical protein